MPAYGYTRHSTNKQKNSQGVQVSSIHSFAAQNSFDLTHSFQWDGKSHGAIFSDPETTSKIKLLARTEGGILCRILQPGDVVIAMRLDRLFRSCEEMEFYIKKWVINGGIKFYLVEQGGMALDVATPDGRAMLRMMAAMAELEREVTSERTHKAMQHKKQARERTSRHAGVCFRFQKVGDKQLRVPNYDEIKLACEMLKWYDAGHGVEDIRKYMFDSFRNGEPWARRELQINGKIVHRKWERLAIYDALKIAKAIRGDQEAVEQVDAEEPGLLGDIKKASDDDAEHGQSG